MACSSPGSVTRTVSTDRILGRSVLLTLLGDQRRDFEAGTVLMREMGFSISQNRYGKSFPENMTPNDELSRDADAFLNPAISSFTFHEALDLFQQGGLAWAAIDQVNFTESGAFLVLEETSRRPPWALDLRRLIEIGVGSRLLLEIRPHEQTPRD